MNKFLYLFILVFGLFLFSCEKGRDDFSSYNRVLVFYMGGDNNLSNEVEDKINAITAGWNADHSTKILIYTDTKNEAPSLSEVIRENGTNSVRTIEIYEKENSADSRVLSRVIMHSQVKFPASSYGMVIFSHASGWLPANRNKIKTKSILVDNEDKMDISDLAKAIPDKAFDFILFEACNMAGIEIAYELKNKTDFILASSAEIVSPGFLSAYKKSINTLFSSPVNLQPFAEEVFRYAEQHSNKNHRSATYCIIKTKELDAFSDWVALNCNFEKEVDSKTIQSFDPFSDDVFFDLRDYYSLIIDEEMVNELDEWLNRIVIWKAATDTFLPYEPHGFRINSHSGLTTYVNQTNYPYYNEEYSKFSWKMKIEK